MNSKTQKSDYLIGLLQASKKIIDTYKVQGFLRNEGTIPANWVFELISFYLIIIKNPYFYQKIINSENKLGTGVIQKKKQVLKFNELKYSPKKYKNKWMPHMSFIEDINCPEDRKNDRLLMTIHQLLENIIIREIKRKSYIKSRNTYLKGDYGYQFPTRFKEYKTMVASYRKKCKEEGKEIIKQSEIKLKERYNEIKLKDNRNKKYDINFKKDSFIANSDFILKLKHIIEDITHDDEYCDWKINYPHLISLNKYRKFIKKTNKEFFEPDENDYDNINKELSRDGLSAFYEGFTEDYLGLD